VILKLLRLPADGNTSTVKEGQQISRDDAAKCGLVDSNGGGATPAAKGPVLDSNAAQWTARERVALC